MKAILICTRQLRIAYLLLNVAVVLILTASPVSVAGGFDRTPAAPDQPPIADAVRVSATGDGLRIALHPVRDDRSPVMPDESADDGTLADWPLVEIGGLRLPARLVAVRVAGDARIEPRIQALASRAWRGQPLPAAAPAPKTREGRVLPFLVAWPAPALPVAPVFLLRESHMRGERIAVIAISPIYAAEGQARLATAFQVDIPDVQLVSADTSALLQQTAPFLAAAPPPANPLAFGDAFKIRVAHAGIQRVTAAALAAAGLDLTTVDPQRLHLWHNGSEVALQIIGASGGRLAPEDEVRFYAAQVGDRWNAGDTYWLTAELLPGLRMALRRPLPGSSPASTTAIGRGVWRNPAIYDSVQSGPDGDHWYTAELSVLPGETPLAITAALTPSLPAISAQTTLTITGSAYGKGPHQFAVVMGGVSQTVSWAGAGDWSHKVVFTSDAPTATMVALPQEALVLLDRVAWQRSVTLDAGDEGVIFTGRPAASRHHIVNAPAAALLYDVTDARLPAVLSLPSAPTLDFQDDLAERTYLLAGPGLLFDAQVSRHTPVDLVAAPGADVVFITPAVFRDALAPLATFRQGQGYRVKVVDVQAIYDAWAFGQASPDAIRGFLRYAAATWNPAPAYVLLVGDGTRDPLNYTGRNNINFIPPYLAMVDPWAGETACDTCYAQLDGGDPLSDLLPDLAIGRLPVNSVRDLSVVIDKIIGYETGPALASWLSRAVFIADDAYDATGAPDPAGDFWTLTDAAISRQPAGLDIQRMYYDPSPRNPGYPWHVANAELAHARTLQLFSAGAGLLTYIGHAHQWQWALTDLTANPPYLLGLYDVDTITNSTQLPIVLDMTCLTAAFQTPAFSGTTVDERLLLHAGGGAVAVWGSTGLGVVWGHDRLENGFSAELWRRPRSAVSIGALTTAGYRDLFENGTCCLSAVRTFVLLGDPVMKARIFARYSIYLPLINR